MSLNAIVGDNGIITNAQRAKELAEETELKEQIDYILVEAAGMDFESEDDYVDWVQKQFKAKGIEKYASIQKAEDGFALVYGKNDKIVEYINDNLGSLNKVEAVEGSSELWTVEGNKIIAYRGKNQYTDVEIPNVVDGVLIAELESNLFRYDEKIDFCDGLTKIGAGLFEGCTKLKKVSSFPTTLREIGNSVFSRIGKYGVRVKF